MSRASWFVAFVGLSFVLLRHTKILFGLIKKKALTLGVFYLLLLTSVFAPLFLSSDLANQNQSIYERRNLIKATIDLIASNRFVGEGLGNSTAQISKNIVAASGLYAFQPVHNIYLVILSDTGIIGLFFFLTLLITATFTSNKIKIVSLGIMSISLLGLFDHYLFSIQQTQILFTILISYSLLKE